MSAAGRQVSSSDRVSIHKGALHYDTILFGRFLQSQRSYGCSALPFTSTTHSLLPMYASQPHSLITSHLFIANISVDAMHLNPIR